MAHFERFINTMTPQPSEQMIAHFNRLLSEYEYKKLRESPSVSLFFSDKILIVI